MKKIALSFLLIFTVYTNSYSQEWFTSFEVAKSYATVHNKMLFVIWEDSLNDVYPVAITTENGKEVFVDLSLNNDIDPLIWDHFVPLLLPERAYSKFIAKAKKEQSVKYINKLNDESIKIMDINGYILNVNGYYQGYENLTSIINNYALNTSYLKQDLRNHSNYKNVSTAFSLASRYFDYAILIKKSLRPEIINLGEIYLKEGEQLLFEDSSDNQDFYFQLLELLIVKAFLVDNKLRRGSRLLNKIEATEVLQNNIPLYSFLNYSIFKSTGDEENANVYISKVSESDLKKAEFILKNNN